MSIDQHNKIVSGIVFGILNFDINNPGNKIGSRLHPEALISDLSSIVRDHYNHSIEILNNLLDFCNDQLKESTIKQMQYLCEVLISKNVPNVRFVILGILRMIRPNYYDLKSVKNFPRLTLILVETL